MLSRWFSWALIFAAGGMLLGGCGSPGRPAVAQGVSAQNRPPGAHARKVAPLEEAPARESGEEAPDAAQEDRVEAHAHYAAGVIHEMNGELDLALNEFYQAAWEDPDNEALVLEVSAEFLQTRQPEKARDLLLRATARPRASGTLYARLGAAYSKLGRRDDAIRAGRIAVQKQPDSLAGYQNLFLEYLDNRQAKEALDLLDQAAKVARPSPEFLVGLAELYIHFAAQNPLQKAAATTQARALLDRAEKAKLPDPQLRLRMADAYDALGQGERAAAAYRALIDQLPDLPLARDSVRSKLAEIYLRNHQENEASEQLQKILGDNPTDSRAYYFLGNIAFDGKRFDEAADYFSKTVLLDPGFERGYCDLAAAQIAADRYSAAIATLEEARKRFPQSFRLEYLSGEAFAGQRDFAAAERHLTAAEVVAQATESKVLTDVFYYALASAQLGNSETNEAVATLDKARQKFPASFAIEFLSGEAFGIRKDYTGAIRHYTAAEAIAQTNDPTQLTNVYFQLGAAYERHGDYALAEQTFEKCLRLRPDFPEALNYLGYMWADRGEKLDRAREFIDKALKAEPKNAAYLDSMGWVLYKLNQPKQALDYELRAKELSDRDDPDVYAHLGDIYAALGEIDKARDAWRKSIALEPNEQLRKKLEAPPGK